MKRSIPNILTLLNLFCGCINLVLILEKAPYTYLILFSLLSFLFDFLDGFLARLLKVKSPMGKQLDSLADLISFGLVPSMIAFMLLKQAIINEPYLPKQYSFMAFLICLCSAWRLARFNLEEEDSSSFKGMPTPVNAALFMGLLIQKECSCLSKDFSQSWLWLSFIILTSSFLLVSSIPMLSFKIKSLLWKENKIRYLFLLTSIIFILLLPNLCSFSYLPFLYIACAIFLKKN